MIDYIEAGDVFQVNLSQRLLAPRGDAVVLYGRLRRCNPATFAGYFDLGEFQIVSASPERFLRVADREVETRPIKGTRPRPATGHDRAAEAELLASEKDRAENVMIVDLLRNDLSRVCDARERPRRPTLRLEAYEHVLHLVSSVCGRLREGRAPIDLLRAAFPGGSITGAPKSGDGDHRRAGADRPRRLLRLAGLPGVRRLVGSKHPDPHDHRRPRLVAISRRRRHRGRSIPEREYEETWHKAEGRPARAAAVVSARMNGEKHGLRRSCTAAPADSGSQCNCRRPRRQPANWTAVVQPAVPAKNALRPSTKDDVTS